MTTSLRHSYSWIYLYVAVVNVLSTNEKFNIYTCWLPLKISQNPNSILYKPNIFYVFINNEPSPKTGGFT